MLAFAINDMNIREQEYFRVKLTSRLLERGMSRLGLSVDLRTLSKTSEGELIEPNPNWFNQQEMMNLKYPQGILDFNTVVNNLSLNQSQSNSSFNKTKVKNNIDSQQNIENQQIKEEVVVEKTNFDVELTAIDAAQKIKIIKEVRTLCNLGLKEAKDLVEKLPALLAKQVIKEHADKIKEVLTPIGCTLIFK